MKNTAVFEVICDSEELTIGDYSRRIPGESKAILTLPGSNIYFQQLVTYINRVIITK